MFRYRAQRGTGQTFFLILIMCVLRWGTTGRPQGCAYLEGEGRCSLHAKGGPEAKPLGCRTFPTSFIDDGDSVRVSVAVECSRGDRRTRDGYAWSRLVRPSVGKVRLGASS